MWCVVAAPAVARQRLMQRNQLSAADADARIAAQIPIAEKERRARACAHHLRHWEPICGVIVGARS